MKLKIFLLIFISFAISTPVLAQEDRFVRRKKQPDFFIPQNILTEKKEKLPSFHINQKKEKPKKIQKPIAEEEYDYKNTYQAEQPQEVDYYSNEELDIQNIVNNEKYLHLLDEDRLEQNPVYKDKFEEYLKDLKYIANTGEYPINNVLHNDLLEMNSNEKLLINYDD